jgi:hypothetical protein
MATRQVLKFSGAGTDKYDAVRSELGWDIGKGVPPGLLVNVGSWRITTIAPFRRDNTHRTGLP